MSRTNSMWENRVLKVPSKPPYSYGWDATIDSIEAPLAGDPGQRISLINVAPEVDHPDEEINGYLAQYVGISKLWYRTITRMYANYLVDDRNTRRMRDCTPTGVLHWGFLRNNRLIRRSSKMEGWVCSSRICPWCHMRLNFNLAKDLQKSGHDYSVGIVRTVVPAEANNDMLRIRKLNRKMQDGIRHRMPSDYVRVAKVFPAYYRGQHKDCVTIRLAYLVRRGDEIEYPGMTWTKPRSIVGILRRLNPYSASYFLCPPDQLAVAFKCAKNLKTTIVSSKTVDYALNVLEELPSSSLNM
jgi:hypothetical protein